MSASVTNFMRLAELLQCGQSYWLDNLTREMIETGELERRVANEGLRGVTSNPKTFADSVQSGHRYDADIARLAKAGESDLTIYETLMIDDVRAGCDILRPVYDESQGEDGFVSIEVDPRLARQTEATLDDARRLWRQVDRPNVMIKIPGTFEGLPAIENALAEGININITLLFSNSRYRQVVARYLKALDRRLQAGLSMDSVASVASFFLSRIDVLVDQLLEHRVLPGCEEHLASALKGKAAIAQARLAYRSFQEAFREPQWTHFSRKGAKVQRPLWASTGVKSADYADTMYVDSLIAENTVNTMPEKTIEAFADHGRARRDAIHEAEDDSDRVCDQLKALGIDLDDVARRLEDEGIQKFIEPFMEGMQAVGEQAAIANGG